jgi:hypothetical protein
MRMIPSETEFKTGVEGSRGHLLTTNPTEPASSPPVTQIRLFSSTSPAIASSILAACPVPTLPFNRNKALERMVDTGQVVRVGLPTARKAGPEIVS